MVATGTVAVGGRMVRGPVQMVHSSRGQEKGCLNGLDGVLRRNIDAGGGDFGRGGVLRVVLRGHGRQCGRDRALVGVVDVTVARGVILVF